MWETDPQNRFIFRHTRDSYAPVSPEQQQRTTIVGGLHSLDRCQHTHRVYLIEISDGA